MLSKNVWCVSLLLRADAANISGKADGTALSELLQRQDVKTAELFRLERDFDEHRRQARQVGQMK